MPPIDFFILQKALIALLLGLLIGAERERSMNTKTNRDTAGIRSFVLITLSGFSSAYLSSFLDPYLVVYTFIPVGGLIICSYLYEAFKLNKKGITSELAAFMAFIVGVLCMYQSTFAIILGIVMAIILSLKLHIHAFVGKISQDEYFATLKFAVIAFIILPILPTEPLDSFGVVNLYNTWLMVVFISGVSFIGYILTKIIGVTKGVGITGLIGGLVSSTAVTTSMSTQSKSNKKIVFPFVIAITAASIMMFARVLFVISVLNAELLPFVAWTLGLMIFMSSIVIGVLYKLDTGKKKIKAKEISVQSPFQFMPALTFGIFYIIILFIVEIANQYFGESGLYIAALISGFADVDAITISLSQLSANGEVLQSVAARTITIAVISNTLIKGAIAVIFGGKQFAKYMIGSVLAVITVGVIGILLI